MPSAQFKGESVLIIESHYFGIILYALFILIDSEASVDGDKR
jgi:hypothetical protein